MDILPGQGLTLKPRPPFSLELTAGYHTYFRGDYGADTFSDGTYRRLWHREGKPLLATVASSGTTDAPELRVEVRGSQINEDDGRFAVERLAWVLATDADLSGFYSLAQGDPLLAMATQKLRGLHPPHTPTVFESLALAIAGQQVSSVVARIIRTLLIQSFGASHFDGRTYYDFPSPEALAEADMAGLRQAKLSARKAEYIQGIARMVASGSLNLEALRGLSQGEVVERLTHIRGVGRWTADWVMIRALGHPDAFPSGDLALRRTLSLLCLGGRPLTPKEAEDFSGRWSPYRSLATVYLFAASRLGLLPELAQVR